MKEQTKSRDTQVTWQGCGIKGRSNHRLKDFIFIAGHKSDELSLE